MTDTTKETKETKEAKEETTSKSSGTITIVVVGASGDLAKKKTFPAIYNLFINGLLPSNIIVAGYARSEFVLKDFHAQLAPFLAKEHGEEKKTSFLERVFYHRGQYESADDFKKLDQALETKEAEEGKKCSTSIANRIFYYAIPPSQFVPVGKSVKVGALSKTGWNRMIIEKPFGRDSETSAALGKEVAAIFTEEQIYRIDHYLGKEMVQTIPTLRFSNGIFEGLWNRHFISHVIISFKEDFGTQGRGGYFDEIGIIRDVLQNHLLQILTLTAMEPPVTLAADDVRNEKVKLLRAIAPIDFSDVVLGQYGPDKDKKNPGYLEDKTVPEGSNCPTFATTVLHINNSRWKGVPFILKAGKALNSKKCDVRIVFRLPSAHLYKDATPNELVIRVQPSEAIYWKVSAKKPGFGTGLAHAELDLTYQTRFGKAVTTKIPEAYERLIYDVSRGDQNLFVRDDELVHAWAIFTPLLHHIEKSKVKPEVYAYGSRGPEAADKLIQKYGYQRNERYKWSPPDAAKAPELD